jgi:outer membrane immunogenic protein
MRQFVVAFLLSSLAIVGDASAADMPLWQAAPPPPAIYGTNPAYKGWGGFYLGANGGYAIGSSQWSLNGTPTNIFDVNGFMAGGTVGFNFPVSEVLFGFEGDIDWAGLTGSVGGCALNAAGAVASCQTNANFLSTARVRVGYAVDRTLFYVTGGGAFSNIQAGLNPPSTFDSGMHVGWVAGAGVEYAFTPNWSAKAEYLFANLGNPSCSTVANCGTAAGANVALTENLVRLGLNYKFSW